jgi:hypothetical protein
MPTVLITSTSNYIKSLPDVSDENTIAIYRRLGSLDAVALHTGRKGTYVGLEFSGGVTWDFDMSNARGSAASVNGVTPADNSALADLLAAIMI